MAFNPGEFYEGFAREPKVESLNSLRKSSLLELARFLELEVRTAMRRDEIKLVIIQHLVDDDVLPQDVLTQLEVSAGTGSAAIELEKLRLEAEMRQKELEAQLQREQREAELKLKELEAQREHEEREADLKQKELEAHLKQEQLRMEQEIRLRELELNDSQLQEHLELEKHNSSKFDVTSTPGWCLHSERRTSTSTSRVLKIWPETSSGQRKCGPSC